MTSGSLLITGATGLLGNALMDEAERRHFRVTGMHCRPSKNPKNGYRVLDLTRPEETVDFLDKLNPNLIIHSAAATDVDKCEMEPGWCKDLNVRATETLARWAAGNRAYFVYISTDSVFDGQRGRYTESDTPSPLNIYAKSKWEGEEAVRQAGGKHLILRTNFFGWGTGDKLSLSEWVLRSFLRQEPIKTFVDVRFSPLLTNHLSRIVFDLLSQKAQGTLHAGSSDSCSKHEFALLVADIFGIRSEILPVSVDTFRFRAARPKDTSFNVSKLQGVLKRPLPTLREGLVAFKEQFDSGEKGRDTSQWHVSSI